MIKVLGLHIDFSDRCPLCGGKDCARFIEYYYRGVIDEKGTYYKAFPVARYLCRGKGAAVIVRHRTFSLLPYQLIPYVKYSIPFIIGMLKKVYGEGRSVRELLDYLARAETGQYIDLSSSTFHGLRRFILKCIDKMLAMGFYKDNQSAFQSSAEKQRIMVFVVFSENFSYKGSSLIRGPCALGYHFYMQCGGYLKNGHFLFGTPSQFRQIG